jgi:hypothetical protein
VNFNAQTKLAMLKPYSQILDLVLLIQDRQSDQAQIGEVLLSEKSVDRESVLEEEHTAQSI